MRPIPLLAALAIAASAAAKAPVTNIEPGDSAPALAVKTWYKGAPIDSFKANKTYVVEFWATWCGPCIQSIPHLTELAKKNPDVDFIGVSIWEPQGDNIPKFIKDMGDKMDYHVGYSGNQDGMAQTWMAAAGQNGIPTAFIVKGGKIQWVGHPMTLEQPLQQVKAGTFDVKAFKTDFDARVSQNRKQMELMGKLSAVSKQYDGGDKTGAATALDALVKDNPKLQREAESIRFGWLAKDDPAAWESKATAMAGSKDPAQLQVVLGFALRQAAQNGNLELGHKALDLAMKATAGKDLLTLQYANAFYKESKEYKLQLSTVDQILDVLPNSQLKDNAEFKASMEKTKKELEDKLQSH